MESTASARVRTEDLTRFCVEVFTNLGLSLSDAQTAASVLVMTDTWGTFSHGTNLLPHHAVTIRAGGINPTARPEVIQESESWATIDGHAALGEITGCVGMELAIAKAKASTLSWVGVRNSTHFGAAGYYANMAAQQNMIGIALSNADPNMSVPGAKGHVIGNNPLAYAVPTGEGRSIMLDIALSAIAGGKIWPLKSRGLDLPGDFLTDKDGLPTDKIGNWPAEGSLMPMAAHKGYGLAILVEVLTAVMTGGGVLSEAKSWVLEPTLPGNIGHSFLVINIGNIMPIEVFKQRIDNMAQEIRDSPKARGSERIYLPGEIEWERRAGALQNGIAFPDLVVERLQSVARELQIAPCSGLG